MARAEDGPTTVTPRALLLAAAFLLAARVGVSGYELMHKTQVKPEVAWTEVQESDLLFAGEEAPRKVEAKPDIEWKDIQEPGQWDSSSTRPHRDESLPCAPSRASAGRRPGRRRGC